jgi:hypothetical protein
VNSVTKNDSKEGAPPLRALRSDQVEKILGDDEFLAVEVGNIREQLAGYGIVLARRNIPALSKSELQRLRRHRYADSGLCMYSAQHGKATHGTRCNACYDVNQENLKARRAKARKAKKK